MGSPARSLPLALLAVLACGPPSGSRDTGSADSDTLILSVIDSIGGEPGDSVAFGSIDRVCRMSDGSILVLDRINCRVVRLSPTGDPIQESGRHGSGPGEFMNPSDIVVLGDDRVLVCDVMSGGVHLLDDSLAYLGLAIGFTSDPPFFPVAACESSFVAYSYSLDISDDGISVDHWVGLYEMSSEPATVYVESSEMIDPTDVTGIVNMLLYQGRWAVDGGGNVYVAPMSPDEYVVYGYRPDGTRFLVIERPAERVARTEEEIGLEEDFVNRRLVSVGSSLPPTYRASEWRLQVRDLYCDREGSIWALRGTVDTPTFDVFDSTGAFRGTAVVGNAGEDSGFWRFCMSPGGILAWSDDPPSVPRIYLLDRESF